MIARGRSRRETLWIALALALPLASHGLGARVAQCASLQPLRFVPGAIAAVIAAVFVAARPLRASVGRAWVALALALLTLAMPDREGVRRWLALGPIALHVSSVCAPVVLAGLAAVRAQGSRWLAIGALLGLQCVHLAQPDAAQSTAVSLAALVIAALDRWSSRERALTSLSLAALTALTWARRDPLGAVPEVEQIVAYAWRAGPLWASGTLASVALWIGALAFRRDALALGFAAYAAGAVVVAVSTERFPVLLVGAGAGPVLGAYVMIALLRAPRERSIGRILSAPDAQSYAACKDRPGAGVSRGEGRHDDVHEREKRP